MMAYLAARNLERRFTLLLEPKSISRIEQQVFREETLLGINENLGE